MTKDNLNLWVNQTHTGDVRAVLKRMIRDGVKVQTIVTSPPYWGLRSYLPKGHPKKRLEIGSERTFAAFLKTMVEVFDLCHQVLAKDGTLWLNMGDSYAGSRQGPSSATSSLMGNGHQGGGPKRQALTESRRRDRVEIPRSDIKVHGFKAKDLIGQPWRLAMALQDAGWWLRQDIIWSKPNPMPESTKDRCTKAHEYVFLMSKSKRYYFDHDAIKEPAEYSNAKGLDASGVSTADLLEGETKLPVGWATGPGAHDVQEHATAEAQGRAQRASGNVKPAKGEQAYIDGDESHRTKGGLFAYAERVAGNGAYADGKSERMGRGPGWRENNGVGWGHGFDPDPKARTVGTKHGNRATFRAGGVYTDGQSADNTAQVENDSVGNVPNETAMRAKRSVWTVASMPYKEAHYATFPPELIEPCVLAGAAPGAIVFDPFMGSGTTAMVAKSLGRKFIGIDIDERNEKLQAKRVPVQGALEI